MIRFLRNISVLGLFLALSSCSGYRVKYPDNPFARYQIKTLSIPMFLNKSNIPAVSGVFTKEIYSLFAGYPNLRLRSGFDSTADAVLLGIIESKDKREDTLTANDRSLVDGIVNKTSAVGSRETFYIPTSNQVNLTLRIVLIKNPTHAEIKALNSKFGPLIQRNSKIILNETIGLSSTLTRENLSFETIDSGGVVNFTRNHGLLNKSINSMAEDARDQFKRTVLYAF